MNCEECEFFKSEIVSLKGLDFEIDLGLRILKCMKKQNEMKYNGDYLKVKDMVKPIEIKGVIQTDVLGVIKEFEYHGHYEWLTNISLREGEIDNPNWCPLLKINKKK